LLKSLYNGLPDFLSPVSSRRAEEYGTSVRQDLERGGSYSASMLRSTRVGIPTTSIFCPTSPR
ncbi:hypothetical protein ACQUKE_25055, partial [Ralstonia pseudosolanacearum]